MVANIPHEVQTAYTTLQDILDVGGYESILYLEEAANRERRLNDDSREGPIYRSYRSALYFERILTEFARNHSDIDLDAEMHRMTESQQSDFCANCFRTQLVHSAESPYHLTFIDLAKDDFKRKSGMYKHTKVVDCRVCMECHQYLTKTNINPNEKYCEENVRWPSFIWSMLSQSEVHEAYGIFIWRLIPKEWRPWWIDQLKFKYERCFREVTLQYPPPLFMDVTNNLNELSEGISYSYNGIDALKKLRDVCNKHLIPSVSCMYGCSEYIHKGNRLPIDVVFQRYLSKVHLKVPAKTVQDVMCLRGSREDFFRDYGDEDRWLFNPLWKLFPSLSFNNRNVPEVHLCRHHEGKDGKYVIHPSRRPDHNLPCAFADQLSNVVVKPRTIKQLRKRYGSNGLQMYRQDGSYNGIDTCSVTKFGDFSICSFINNENENRIIGNRPDSKAIFNNLIDNKVLSQCCAHERIEHAEKVCSNVDYVRHNTGATYMPFDTCIETHRDHTSLSNLKFVKDHLNPNNPVIQNVPTRTFPLFIYPCQRLDSYGAIPCIIPNVSYMPRKWRPFVIKISQILCTVEQLWLHVASSDIYRTSQWEGWLLHYLTKQCFSHLKKSFKYNVFATQTLDRQSKFVEMLEDTVGSYAEDDDFDSSVIVNRLLDLLPITFSIDHEQHRPSFTAITDMVSNNPGHDVILIHNYIHHDPIETEIRTASDNRYILKHISNDKTTFMRHGDGTKKDSKGFIYHNKWWQINNGKLPIKVSEAKALSCDLNKTLVYVRVQSSDVTKSNREYLRFLGGQNNYYCREHQFPLIRSTIRTDICTNHGCQRKIFYCCPATSCRIKCCKKCVEETENSDIQFADDMDVDEGESLGESLEVASVESADSETLLEPSHDPYDQLFGTEEGVEAPQEELNQHDISETVPDDTNDYNNIIQSEEGHEINMDNITEFLTADGTEDFAGDPYFTAEFNDTTFTDAEQRMDEIFEADIPTTDTGNTPYTIKESNKQFGNGDFSCSGHVLLNQCGTLLTRKRHDLKGSTKHHNMIHGLVATNLGTSTPLLQPEAMMYPSIFWKAIPNENVIAGALPACMLHDGTPQLGFQNIPSHIRARLLSPSSCTSTDPRYITWCYDMLVNLSANRFDTRVAINRGLTVCGDVLGVRGGNDSASAGLLGSIDSSQMVKNLCASQHHHPMDYFITFTCNQLRHFGTSILKEWIDGEEWKKHYPTYATLNPYEQKEVDRALTQAAGPLMLRNWQEVCQILIDFLRYSKNSPFKNVDAIFSRNEYQASVGNLSHIHLMLKVAWHKLTQAQRDFVNDLIRADLGNLVRSEEVESLIEQGLLEKVEDVEDIQKDGRTFLRHICNDRCWERIAPGSGPECFRCRKVNNGKVTPDNTKDHFIPLNNDLPATVKERLKECGLLQVDENGKEKYNHKFFNPSRHIPKIDHNTDENISPVESKLFLICRSMQNIQKIQGTGGCNKYVCKYIAKIDEQNYIVVNTSQNKDGSIETSATFLHNTKISRSARNEEKERDSQRAHKRPQGRSISLNEMLHVMLKYPEVISDLRFVNIPTVPLEQRARIPLPKDTESLYDDVDDGQFVDPEIVLARSSFPPWRQISGTQIMMLNDLRISKQSVDRITEFSLRPPELQELFPTVGNYFRWFEIEKKVYTGTDLIDILKDNVDRSTFVDGLKRKVVLRVPAFKEVRNHLSSLEGLSSNATQMRRLLYRIMATYESDEPRDAKRKNKFSKLFLNTTYDAHLPVPVYSYTKPTQGYKFVLHVLLSMGAYTTEAEVTMHPTLRDCFRAAKLIGDSDELHDLKKYSSDLLNRFIVEQLVYFSNSRKVLGEWILLIADIFDSIIIDNEMLVTEMPSVQMSSIMEDTKTEIAEYKRRRREAMIDAAYKELGPDMCANIPTKEQLMSASLPNPINWDPLTSFKQGATQNDESFKEQKLAVKVTCAAIDKYIDLSRAAKVSKNIGIRGFPGGGKTYTGIYCIIYAMSQGLDCIATAIMGTRAAALGGIHWHKLLGIPIDKKLTPQRLAEIALNKIEFNPPLLNFIQTLDVIFADELGQLSAEFVCTLNIILCRIRGNGNIFGGCLLIGTLDHTQIQPWDGRPFLTSPLVIPAFDMVQLKYSVRTNDAGAYEMQDIARMNYNILANDETKVNRFIELASTKFTFVDSWNDERITKQTYRVYSKRVPVVDATADFVAKVRNEYWNRGNECRFKPCEDLFRRIGTSRHNWLPVPASRQEIIATMNTKFKVGSELCFYKGAVFECTYNDRRGRFLTSEALLLYDIPEQQTLDNWRPVKLLKVPCGWKDFAFDMEKSKDWYLQNGFQEVSVPVAPVNQERVNMYQTQRKQYALRHRITGTIHSSMGHTYDAMASEISNTDPKFGIWDKGMLVVLISRTRKPENTIFVGNKNRTLAALRRVLLSKTMWTDYVEDVLNVVTINGEARSENVIRTTNYPFRISDMRLPSLRTGIVYMLVSLRNQEYTYIGKTFHPRTRLYNHNSGYGSSSTQPYHLRPFAVMAYISGFGDDGGLMLAVERKWKQRRDYLISQGIFDPRQWAMQGDGMANDDNLRNAYEIPRLSLHLLFNT